MVTSTLQRKTDVIPAAETFLLLQGRTSPKGVEIVAVLDENVDGLPPASSNSGREHKSLPIVERNFALQRGRGCTTFG